MEALALVAKASSRHSLYKGVTLYKPTNKWRAQISHGGRTVTLGDYNTEEEAARVFDRACICKYGKDAVCNFPIEDYRAEWDDLQATNIPGLLVKFKEERQRNKTARALYDIKAGQVSVSAATATATATAMLSRSFSRPRPLPRQQGAPLGDTTHHDSEMSPPQDAFEAPAEAPPKRPQTPRVGVTPAETSPAAPPAGAEHLADGSGGGMGCVIRAPVSGADGASTRTDTQDLHLKTLLRSDTRGYFAWELRSNHITALRLPPSASQLNHMSQQISCVPVAHTRSPVVDTGTPTVSGYQRKHQRLPLSRGSSSSSPEVARLPADGSPHLVAGADWSVPRHASGSDSSELGRVEVWETPAEPGGGNGCIPVYKTRHGGVSAPALAIAAVHNPQRVSDGSSAGPSGTDQQLPTVNDRSSLLATASSNGDAPMAWQYAVLGSKLRNTTTAQPAHRPPVVLSAERRAWALSAGTMYDMNCQPTYLTVTSDRLTVDMAARRSAPAGFKRSADTTAELVSLTQGNKGGHIQSAAVAAATATASDDTTAVPIRRLGSLDLRGDAGMLPSRSSSVINFNGRQVVPLELLPAKRLRLSQTESQTVATAPATVTIPEEPQTAAATARDQPHGLRTLLPNRFHSPGGLPAGLSYVVDANTYGSQGKGTSVRVLEHATAAGANQAGPGGTPAVALKPEITTGNKTNGATTNGRPTLEALKHLLVAALLRRQEEEEAQERLRQQQRHERQEALGQMALALGLQPLVAEDAEALLREVLAAAAAAGGHGSRQAFGALSPTATATVGVGSGSTDGAAAPSLDGEQMMRLMSLVNGRQPRPSSGAAPSSNSAHLQAAANAVQMDAAAELCDRRGVANMDLRTARPASATIALPTRMSLQLPAGAALPASVAHDLADADGAMVSLRSAAKPLLRVHEAPVPVVVRLPMHMSGGSSRLRGVLKLDDGPAQQQQQQRLVLKQDSMAEFSGAGLAARMIRLPVMGDS